MATTGTDEDIKALQAEIKELRADFANVSETLRDLVRHGGAEAAAKARESGEKIWDEARKHVHDVAHEIEAKPVPAAITAFSIGLVIGMLFSGRRG
jgi:ElaB/YqjD/DUF883 family membrane-anchored ribosome-binding protein